MASPMVLSANKLKIHFLDCFRVEHRRRKEWGYGAAAPPDFKSAHRILFFTIEIFSCLSISPT